MRNRRRSDVRTDRMRAITARWARGPNNSNVRAGGSRPALESRPEGDVFERPYRNGRLLAAEIPQGRRRAQQHFDRVYRRLGEVRYGAVAGPNPDFVRRVTDRCRFRVHCLLNALHHAHGAIAGGRRSDDREVRWAEAPNRIGDASRAPNERRQVRDHVLRVTIERTFLEVWRFGYRRECDARDWRPQSLCFGGDFARSAHESAHVVQAGCRIEQAFGTQAVRLTLAAHKRIEFEQQHFTVERLARELPGTGLQRAKPLVPLRWTRCRNNDRSGGVEARIVEQLPAHISTVHVRQPDVHDDEIRLRASCKV